MLQQTRVAAVIPYYERFLEAFPDAARARRRARVSGPGDVERTRLLLARAQSTEGRAAHRESGGFPRDYESIRKWRAWATILPRQSPASLSDLPHAVLDGNVRRVIVRLLGDNHANVREQADRFLDRRNPGRWNQALMELGAIVCLPREPRCGQCPLARHCEAQRQGTQKDLPAKLVKPAPVRLERTLLWIHRGNRILLAPSPRVKGFWDLPGPFPGARLGKIVGEFRHTIMHRHYQFIVQEATAKTKPDGASWFTFAQIKEIPLSIITKKAMRTASHSALIPV